MDRARRRRRRSLDRVAAFGHGRTAHPHPGIQRARRARAAREIGARKPRCALRHAGRRLALRRFIRRVGRALEPRRGVGLEGGPTRFGLPRGRGRGVFQPVREVRASHARVPPPRLRRRGAFGGHGRGLDSVASFGLQLQTGGVGRRRLRDAVCVLLHLGIWRRTPGARPPREILRLVAQDVSNGETAAARHDFRLLARRRLQHVRTLVECAVVPNGQRVEYARHDRPDERDGERLALASPPRLRWPPRPRRGPGRRRQDAHGPELAAGAGQALRQGGFELLQLRAPRPHALVPSLAHRGREWHRRFFRRRFEPASQGRL
mmetsp:Transcript_8132/g.28122  ORF Transcript_8132/g.28122 Transcript_8132/m.28122 type:complete len:320 (+) Transcript_8132:1545-2504(+)